MAKKKNANKGQSGSNRQRTTPAKKAIKLMCLILALLMAAGGIVYIVQYILGSIGG